MVANTSSTANKNAREAGEEANRLIQQVAGGQDEVVVPGEDDPAQVSAKAEAAKQNLDPAKSLDGGAEPSQADKDWEVRFKGSQAAYNRDVPKLRGELSTAYSDIETLRGEVEELKEAINKPAEPTVEPVVLELTAEEEEQYGPGWIAMMQKIAQGGNTDMAKQIVDLQQELANVKHGQKQIVEHTVVSDEERFFSTLNGQVANWEQINNSSEFHIFLDEEVPYTGKTRRNFLDTARERLDSAKVIQIFTDFASVVPQGSSLNSEPTPDLDVPESLITPKNSGGGAPPVEEQKYYTNSQVNKFYNDKAAGKYKGKEEEARMIEKDIFAAGKEGRILTDRQAERAYKFSEKDLS